MAVIQLECCVTVIQCVKTVWFCTSQRDNWERERERETDRQTDRDRARETPKNIFVKSVLLILAVDVECQILLQFHK